MPGPACYTSASAAVKREMRVREEKNARAELDFLLQAAMGIVPVEVKSGSHGSLKSLHQYLRRSGTELGVRVHGGPLKMERNSVALPDGSELRYRLLSVPFYLVFRLAGLCKAA